MHNTWTAFLIIQATILMLTATPASADTISVPKNHRSIQAAINAASPGDTVLVSPGTYNERVQLKPGVLLKSAGDNTKGKLGLKRAEETIIDGGGQKGKGAGITMAQGAIVDGFTVTNVGLYDDAKWKKHHATQGENQSHEHIGEPGTAGISVIGVTCTVKNNLVHHIGYTGIAIQGIANKQTSPHIYRNICYRNMGGGIGSMSKSTAIIEENICFQNFYAGIGHDNSSPQVINNTCYENIRAGIGISEGACPTVRGNKCYKNRRAGIGTRTGANTRPIIANNDCYENDMAGIGTREKASPLIRNNRCYKNKLAGIGSRTQATPTITDNECYENGMAGIGQQSDAVTVLIGNYCHHNKTSGIGFASCKNGKSTVINNKIIDNALVAVGINPGWSVQLTGNTLSRNGGLPPIIMIFKGATATLTSNNIRGSGVAGIRVAGTVHMTNNQLDGISIRKAGPPHFAVWALPGSRVTMTSNKLSNWRHGLSATQTHITLSNNTITNFHKSAFVIQETEHKAVVHDNIGFSDNPKDAILTLIKASAFANNNAILPNSKKN